MRTTQLLLLAACVSLAAAMIQVPSGYYVADDFQKFFKPSPQEGWVREMISVGDAWYYGKTNMRDPDQFTSLPWHNNDDCFGAGYGWNGCLYVKENGLMRPGAGAYGAGLKFKFLQRYNNVAVHLTVTRPSNDGDGNDLLLFMKGESLMGRRGRGERLDPGQTLSWVFDFTDVRYGDELLFMTGANRLTTDDEVVVNLSIVAACEEVCNCHNCIEEYLEHCPTPAPTFTPVPGQTPFPPDTTFSPDNTGNPEDVCEAAHAACNVTCGTVDQLCTQSVPLACDLAQSCHTLSNDCQTIAEICDGILPFCPTSAPTGSTGGSSGSA